jgi:CheY-like chemotaxis protein
MTQQAAAQAACCVCSAIFRLAGSGMFRAVVSAQNFRSWRSVMLAKKIVLSDSAELLSVIEGSFFRREGFDLLVAQGGDAAYCLVEAEGPAMAILDLAVDSEDGLACCRRIKGDPLLRETPLMLLLPDGEGGSLADACWNAGCDAVVQRPLMSPPSRVLDAACALLGVSRRLARRFPVNFRLAFVVEGGRQHAGSAVNLNAGGMFVAAEKLFPIGTGLLLEFILPGFAEALGCKGRVAWVNHPEWRKKTALPSGMGIQFIDPAPALLDALQQLIDRLQLKD